MTEKARKKSQQVAAARNSLNLNNGMKSAETGNQPQDRTGHLRVAEIHLPEGSPLDEAKVLGLAHSISTLGLLEYPAVDLERNLIYGRHHVEAVRRLGWLTVPCRIRSWDHLRAEPARIDENWMRRDLCILERAEVAARRVEIVEALGQRRRPGGQPDPDTVSGPLRTTAEMAADMGVSDRTLQRYLRIATIPKEVRGQIRETWLAESTRTLMEIAGTPADRQAQVVAEFLAQPEQDADEVEAVESVPVPSSVSQPEQMPVNTDAAVEGTPSVSPVAIEPEMSALVKASGEQPAVAAPPVLILVPSDDALAGDQTVPLPSARRNSRAVGKRPRPAGSHNRTRSEAPGHQPPGNENPPTDGPPLGVEGQVTVEVDGSIRAVVPDIRVARLLPATSSLRVVPRWRAELRLLVDQGVAILILPDVVTQ